MKQNRVSSPRRAPRTDAARRVQLLAAFDRSGLSAADFARQQGIHYTTFSGWRQRRGRGQPRPAFVQVELEKGVPHNRIFYEQLCEGSPHNRKEKLGP
jgi:hypothetical protein